MKKFSIILAVTAAVFVLIASFENKPGAILSKIETADLNAQAKQLCYKIYLLGIFPVGEAVLSDKSLTEFRSMSLHHLNATAEGSGIVSKLYPFSARIDSYLEPKSLLPLIFLQTIKTKDREAVKEVAYDQTKHIMQIKEEKRRILPETYEPLSALLKLRRLDLEKTATFDLNINTNQKNYAFTGRIRKSAVKVKEKNAELYKLSATILRRDKNPYHRSKVDFIFLANEQKTPLLIKVFASGALITARLIDIN